MSRARRYGVLAAGILLVLVGAAVWLATPTTTSGFGWTAYTPLSSSYVVITAVDAQRAIAGFVAAIGGMLITGWIGYRAGRRRT